MTVPDDGVRAAYDVVAHSYAEQLGAELDDKPLDRALLSAMCELTQGGTLADLGCGPGHVTRFLAQLHADVIGIDLSGEMIAVARTDAPGIPFTVGSMLDLPLADDALAGAVALYSVIHFTPGQRRTAFLEIHRVLHDGGHLLVAFHIDGPGLAPGDVHHATELLGHPVTLDGYFIRPDDLVAELVDAGFTLVARLDRAFGPGPEYPSNRSYVLVRAVDPGPA